MAAGFVSLCPQVLFGSAIILTSKRVSTITSYMFWTPVESCYVSRSKISALLFLFK